MAANSLHPQSDSTQPPDLAARRRTAFFENELARIVCSVVATDCEQPVRTDAAEFLNGVDEPRLEADAADYFANMLHYAIRRRLTLNIHYITDARQPAFCAT